MDFGFNHFCLYFCFHFLFISCCFFLLLVYLFVSFFLGWVSLGNVTKKLFLRMWEWYFTTWTYSVFSTYGKVNRNISFRPLLKDTRSKRQPAQSRMVNWTVVLRALDFQFCYDNFFSDAHILHYDNVSSIDSFIVLGKKKRTGLQRKLHRLVHVQAVCCAMSSC